MAARRPANAFDEKSPFPRIQACGLRAKRPARTVRVCRAAAKGAPRRRNGRNGRPAARLGALRHTNTPQPVTRRGSDSRTASRTNAPQPKWTRLISDWRALAQPNSPQPEHGSPAARIDAPQPNPRAKAGRGAPRSGLPCRRPPWRSAVWMDAAQRGQKAGSVPPFPFSLPDVRFAPACAPAHRCLSTLRTVSVAV